MSEPIALDHLADALADHARELEALRALHDATTARLEALQLDVADVIQAAAGSAGCDDQRQGDDRQSVYDDWHTWVTHWLEPRISRAQHHKWCPKLDEHPEAHMRLEAVWHAWESTWPRPPDRAGWLRDHLDPQLSVLFASDGPLRLCSAHEHQHAMPPALDELGGERSSSLSVPSPDGQPPPR